jgi:molybdate transport system ATP-binding protein
VIVLDGGRIVEQGAAREVLLNPQTEFTRLLTFGLGAV